MVNQFTCPYCEEQVENRNSLCDKCWSNYLGTHIGKIVDEKCDCPYPICLSIQMQYKTIQEVV